MRVLIVIIGLAMVLVSGCGRSDTVTDQRMNDPKLLSQDKELQKGDLGIGENGVPGIRGLNKERIPVVRPNPAIEPIGGNYANNVITFAKIFLGTPYEYGSDRDNPATFDCSAFVRYAFLGALGMDIPKDSRSQARYVLEAGTRSYYSLAHARRGDILFFMGYKGFREEDYAGIDPSKETISHCGIYLGDGLMIHTASQKTGGVRIDDIFDKHLEWRFVMGGSVLPW